MPSQKQLFSTARLVVQKNWAELLELAVSVADMFIKIEFDLKVVICHAEALKFSLSLFITVLPSLHLISQLSSYTNKNFTVGA